MSGSVAVVGGGSWGTALALHAARAGRSVRLWVHDAALERSMREGRENRTYLPGHPLPENLETSADLQEVLQGEGTAVLVVPSHHLREVVRRGARALAGGRPLVVATKGIEEGTLRRMSELVAEECGVPARRIATLSGPSFAQEVAAGHPTAVVIGAVDAALGARMQREWSAGNLRAYRNPDQLGVELGGALKNVVAIAAGIVDGLGLGSNTRAALLTRGLHEITRLAVALGARRPTMAGLAGMGDLVLTCTGGLSRNRQVGIELGRGRPLRQILAEMKMVAEGVRTCSGAVQLARRAGVEMPIADRMEAILFSGASPEAAIRELLSRSPKEETRL
ncbi:MAG: NAD(P)H-dependent glycerol-3-phosphate dehydrogenase [Acidobacteriota bacterium]